MMIAITRTRTMTTLFKRQKILFFNCTTTATMNNLNHNINMKIDSFKNLSLIKKRQLMTCFAKKKKSNQEKKSLAEMMSTEEEKKDPWLSVDNVMLLLLVVESYKRQIGKPLMEGVEIMEIANAIWEAPFGMIIREKEGNIIYANKAALELYEITWDALFINKSADLCLKEADVKNKNKEEWSGEGKSSKGNEFKVEKGILFNIMSPDDEIIGEGNIYEKWVFEDGRIGGGGGGNEPSADAAVMPSDEEMIQLEIKIKEQGDFIRNLKENHGMTNDDEEVKENVKILLALKKEFEEIKRLFNSNNND